MKSAIQPENCEITPRCQWSIACPGTRYSRASQVLDPDLDCVGRSGNSSSVVRTRMTGLRLSARTTSCGVVGLRPICLGMTSGVSRDVFVGGRVRKNAALSLCFLIFCSSILPVTCFWLPGFNRALGGGGGSSTLTFPKASRLFA